MSARRSPSSGLARRSRRLSDQETRDRMLQAAIAMINRTGLTVSLDHIGFEDLIREAGVSRSTAYRHWPYKDLFFSDLVKELATTAGPPILRGELALIRQVLAEHPGRLETAELRHRLLLELIRRLALLDFQEVSTSPGWRTYLALHATVSGLADDGLRAEIQAALAQSDAAHTARVAQAWQQVTTLFGYRLRPELATTFEALATLVDATLRGLVITALSSPETAAHTASAQPFGTPDRAEWSLPALGVASLAMSFLEPDPAVEWTADRPAEIHRLLDAWKPEE